MGTKIKETPTLNEIRNSLNKNMNGIIRCKDILIDYKEDSIKFLQKRIKKLEGSHAV